MNNFRRPPGGFAVLLAVIAVFAFVPAAHAANKTITIGTAGETGVYYPAGGAICRLVNRGMQTHGIRCTATPTGGSHYNLKALQSGKIDLGVIQSDWQYYAYHGSKAFGQPVPDTSLRAVFSLHPEPLTIMTRADSRVHVFHDLKGKRVNVGPAGAGTSGTLEEVLRAYKWSYNTFGAVMHHENGGLAAALCGGEIDAAIVPVGHPNGLVRDIAMTCPIRLVDVSGPQIEALIARNPIYVKTVIPGNMYPGIARDTRTFGVKATLVASTKTSPEVVYQVVKAVFDNFDNFKTLHPLFAALGKRRMLTEANSAPFHEGALRYYREQGWLR